MIIFFTKRKKNHKIVFFQKYHNFNQKWLHNYKIDTQNVLGTNKEICGCNLKTNANLLIFEYFGKKSRLWAKNEDL